VFSSSNVGGRLEQLNLNMQAQLFVWVLMPNCSMVSTTSAG
jgi:hypothetical protein